MNSLLALTVAVGSLALLTPAMPQEVPPGHPAMKPRLPQEHPQVDEPAKDAASAQPAVEANPADVASPQAVVDAYYAALAGSESGAQDWDRFRSLFRPDTMLLSVRAAATAIAPPSPMTVDQYVRMNGGYFASIGYRETPIRNDINQYGGLAQVFSTFESYRKGDAEAYSRGINGFQLVFDGRRWWISALSWQSESPESGPIPDQFLNTGS